MSQTPSKELNYEIAARDTVTGTHDAMKAKVRVEASVPDRVLQATLLQLEKKEKIPIQQPTGNLPGRGELTVSGEATLVRGLDSVKSYMQDYPYTCLEQKISPRHYARK